MCLVKKKTNIYISDCEVKELTIICVYGLLKSIMIHEVS